MDNTNKATTQDPNSTPNPIAPTPPTKDHKIKNPILIAIIAFLVLLIIGTIIAIIVVANNQTDTSDNNNIAPVYKSAIEIQKSIQATFEEDRNIENLISSYQTAIDDAMARENYELAVTLIDYRTSNLVSSGFCSKAMYLLQNVNTENLDIDSLATFYSNAMSTSISCSNTEQYDIWKNQYLKLSEEF